MFTQKGSYLTREGYQKFEEELNYLRDQRRDEIADLLKEMLILGDAEDSTYDMVKQEQAFVEGRIQELELLLAKAQVIDDQVAKEVIQIGSKVTIQEEGFDPEYYRIVGPAEADPAKGYISNFSPLGGALMNHKPGDRVRISSPDGSFEVVILKVE